jgi:hypothetical protein
MYAYQELVGACQRLLRRSPQPQFSGLGVVIYRGEFNALPTLPLVRDAGIALPVAGVEEIAHVLVSISQYHDARHDGFHFIHEDAGLTHLCRYFSPSIPRGFDPVNYRGGARYRTAELGSLHSGIVAIAIVGATGDCYGFRNGTVEVCDRERA